jgi:uncharacterized protein (DUF433 family)
MTDSNIVGAFSEEQVVKLTKISLNQLRSWDADGFFSPSFGSVRSVPYGRIYSFRDIVSLRILHDLRNEKKIPLQHLREVSEKLSHLGESKWTSCTLYVLGKRVVFKDPRNEQRQEIVSGQRVFDIPLRVVISSTKEAVAQLNKREGQSGEITHTRFISQNEPIIAGTRIKVSSITEFAAAGYSVAEIIREFPDLTEKDIAAAICYQGGAIAA